MRVRLTSKKDRACTHGCPIFPNYGDGLCGTCLHARILGAVVVDEADKILEAYGSAIGHEEELQKLILAYPLLNTKIVQLASNGTTQKRRELAAAEAAKKPAEPEPLPEPLKVETLPELEAPAA